MREPRPFGSPSSHAAKRDRTGYRAHPFADRVTIVAALDDPLRADAPRDDPDMMPPDHHDADAGAACVGSRGRPISRKPEFPLIHPELASEPPSAPGGWAAAGPGSRHAGDAMAPKAMRGVAVAVRDARGRMSAMECVMSQVVGIPVMSSASLRSILRKNRDGGE